MTVVISHFCEIVLFYLKVDRCDSFSSSILQNTHSHATMAQSFPPTNIFTFYTVGFFFVDIFLKYVLIFLFFLSIHLLLYIYLCIHSFCRIHLHMRQRKCHSRRLGLWRMERLWNGWIWGWTMRLWVIDFSFLIEFILVKWFKYLIDLSLIK